MGHRSSDGSDSGGSGSRAERSRDLDPGSAEESSYAPRDAKSTPRGISSSIHNQQFSQEAFLFLLFSKLPRLYATHGRAAFVTVDSTNTASVHVCTVDSVRHGVVRQGSRSAPYRVCYTKNRMGGAAPALTAYGWIFVQTGRVDTRSDLRLITAVGKESTPPAGLDTTLIGVFELRRELAARIRARGISEGEQNILTLCHETRHLSDWATARFDLFVGRSEVRATEDLSVIDVCWEARALIAELSSSRPDLGLFRIAHFALEGKSPIFVNASRVALGALLEEGRGVDPRIRTSRDLSIAVGADALLTEIVESAWSRIPSIPPDSLVFVPARAP